MAIRILLAEDHHLVRKALATLLEREPHLKVVGDVSDGLAVLPEIERTKPDVAVIDLMLPGLGGLEVTRRVTSSHPDVRVLILSMHKEEAYVLKALQNGAAGYVLKQGDPSDLPQAVREAASGRRYLSPPLTDLAIEAYLKDATSESFDAYETLTGREREVLQLSAECHTNAEMASLLFISKRTVECHRAKVMQKLHLKNKADLIHFAVARGIVTRD